MIKTGSRCLATALVFILSGCAPLGTAFHAAPEMPPAGPPPAVPGPRVEEAAETGPLALTVAEAVVLSLDNNPSLAVQRYEPELSRTVEDERLAVFDPVLSGSIETGSRRSSSGGDGRYSSSTDAEISASLEKTFTGGTSAGIEASSRLRDDSGPDAARLGLTLTQPLLRGYGVEVNLAPLEQARLDTAVSEYELRGFTESLVAQVEVACWDFVLARRQVEIVEQSLELARRQLDEIQEQIGVGRMARVEEVAAVTEVARRQGELINARSARETARLKLLRLLGAAGEGGWDRELDLLDAPEIPAGTIAPVEENVDSALRMRPDLNQARLEVRMGDLEVVRTKNGLLPRLDFFVTLGKSGYRDSYLESFGDLPGGEGYDIQLGINTQFPLYNREALAADRRAALSLDQSKAALENLRRLIQLDVRSAWIEAGRLREQISATLATRGLQEKNLEAETEKFRVGRSTSFLVAQAQRDLVQSRIDEVRAAVNYLKALVELYRLDGSLLERRGIKIK